MTEGKEIRRHRLPTGMLPAGGLFFFLILCPRTFSFVQPENCFFPAQNFFFEALDASDLDARDAQNRPIKSAAPLAHLKSLFQAAVIDLLMVRDLPLVSAGRSLLKDILKPVRHLLTRGRRWLSRAIELAVLFNFKRLVEKLKFISSVLAFLLAQAFLCLRFCRYLPAHNPLLTQTVPLRC